MKRVYCLYRVSTKGQVDHNDIPMQRIECRKFAEEKGWTILREEAELGVSGYKVSAERRVSCSSSKPMPNRENLTFCSSSCSTA